MILDTMPVMLHHPLLDTTFRGIEHSVSTDDLKVQQFRGIKYASIPRRFRQSKLFASYPRVTDATKYGPICPQPMQRGVEEGLIGLSESDIPRQVLKQDEFGCLNLNITCPANTTSSSRLPVMMWFHGGGNRGCGSSWIYDGGALVRKSLCIGKPVIIVTFNFRVGLLGFAASPAIEEDNIASGDDGVGNYGLRDQRKALEWVYHFIADFGGDPHNITLFGVSTGAADILNHLYSAANKTRPLFQRSIVQSALVENTVPDIRTAGWHLSKVMTSLHVSTLEQLRSVDAHVLSEVDYDLRATDDGYFFRSGWRDSIVPEDHHLHHHHLESEGPMSSLRINNKVKTMNGQHHGHNQHHGPARSMPSSPGLQPMIIGDCGYDSFLWSRQISHWTAAAVTRRLRALCQSIAKANALVHAYDISSYSPPHEVIERVLELVNDARVAWPTECVAQASKRERGGHGVWRYVFDQEGPGRGIPHHAADLIYLFDNVPLPLSPPSPMSFDDEPLEICSPSSSNSSCTGPVTSQHLAQLELMDADEFTFDPKVTHTEDVWTLPVVDEWTYMRVRDTMQEKWIAFAYGQAPWNEENAFVFGPEGETGERSACIFEGRRRRQLWKIALEPLGTQLVHKIGVELSNGPSGCPKKAKF